MVSIKPATAKIKGRKIVPHPKKYRRELFNLISKLPCLKKERIINPEKERKRMLPTEKMVDFLRRTRKERRKNRREGSRIGETGSIIKLIISNFNHLGKN